MRRLVLASAIVLTGCELAYNVGDLTSSAGDASLDAAPDFLQNPGFEQTGGGCGPGWTVSNATMNVSTNAHTGASSCKVCIVKAGEFGQLTASPAPITNPNVGDTYYAQAWVEIEQGAALSSVTMWINEFYSGGSKTKAAPSADPKNVSWQELQGRTGAIDDAGTGVGFNIQLFPLEGGTGCVYVDDTSLTP